MSGATVVDIPFDARALLQPGPVAASEIVATLGYGRVIKGFRLGVAAKVLEQRIGSSRDATAAFDIGLVRRVFGITWGVAAQNLGPGLSTGTGGPDVPLPHRVTLAASTSTRPVGPLDLLATAAVSRRRDGEFIPAGGIEISWWPIIGRTFTGRIGLRGQDCPFINDPQFPEEVKERPRAAEHRGLDSVCGGRRVLSAKVQL
jgi:hypothetical protein